MKSVNCIPSSEYHPTAMHLSVSLSIGSSFKHAAVTESPNFSGVSNSNSTASPEYKKCLNFVYEFKTNFLCKLKHLKVIKIEVAANRFAVFYLWIFENANNINLLHFGASVIIATEIVIVVCCA